MTVRRRRRKRKEIIVPDNEVEKEMGEVCGSGDGYLNHVKQFYVTNRMLSKQKLRAPCLLVYSCYDISLCVISTYLKINSITLKNRANKTETTYKSK